MPIDPKTVAGCPRPWRLALDEDAPSLTDWPILDAEGNPVLVTDSGFYPPQPDVSRLIVEAVNAHESLVALVRRFMGLVEALPPIVAAQALMDAEMPEWRKGDLVEGGNEGCRRLSAVMGEAYRLTEGDGER